MFIKKLLKRIPFIQYIIQKAAVNEIDREYADLDPADIFKKIYSEKTWGGNNKDFYSGSGSYGEVANYYINIVKNVIEQNNITSITDVGCGDFAISEQIISTFKHIRYIGLDVFTDIIEHNKNNYQSQNIQFIKLDATKAKIPYSDLVTIRQVLQHLSNDDILNVLSNLPKKSLIIVTEHILPLSNKDLIPNLDKASGPNIRLKKNSSVYLNLPPFNANIEELGRIRQDQFGKEAYIVTYLIRN